MVHYYKGSLADTSLITVIVAALVVSALLAPAYKWRYADSRGVNARQGIVSA
jgi:hypothetical protein